MVDDTPTDASAEPAPIGAAAAHAAQRHSGERQDSRRDDARPVVVGTLAGALAGLILGLILGVGIGAATDDAPAKVAGHPERLEGLHGLTGRHGDTWAPRHDRHRTPECGTRWPAPGAAPGNGERPDEPARCRFVPEAPGAGIGGALGEQGS